MTAPRRTPGRRRPFRSNEALSLESLRKHLAWRLQTAAHGETPALASRLIALTKDIEAARRRDRQAAANAAERQAQERTERQIRRLMRAMRAELRADGEPCGEDLLREMAEVMIDDGSASEFLASFHRTAAAPLQAGRAGA